MRIIRFEQENHDVTDGKRLLAGVDYVVTRTLLPHYCKVCDGYLSVRDYAFANKFDAALDWNDKHILIHRFGCAGDILFTTPLLREINRRWPHARVTFHCEAKYHWILARNPHVTACVSSPLLLSNVEAFDAQISLEDATENSPLAKTHTAVAVFAAAAGIDRLADDKTLYSTDSAIVEAVARRFPKTARRRVGISLASNSVIRDYPYQLFLQVIDGLMRAGMQVVLLGKEAVGVKRQPLFIDLAGELPKLSWEESIAFMKTCDLVVGPDSGAIHFAGAMGVPSLGLYGSFPAALRIPTQPATQAVQATGVCAPCFHHARRHVEFPPDGPCKNSGRCEVLASIPPQQVVDKAREMLGG